MRAFRLQTLPLNRDLSNPPQRIQKALLPSPIAPPNIIKREDGQQAGTSFDQAFFNISGVPTIINALNARLLYCFAHPRPANLSINDSTLRPVPAARKIPDNPRFPPSDDSQASFARSITSSWNLAGTGTD